MINIRLLLLISLSAGGFASAADLTMLSGKKYTGTPTQFENGILTIKLETETVSVSAKEILSLDLGGKALPSSGIKFDEVVLTDGSIFRVASFKIKQKQFEATLLAVPNGVAPPNPAIALGHVFHLLRNADQANVRESWTKLVAGRGKRDLFESRATDGQLSPLPGTVLEGTADGESASFEREDGQVTTLQLKRATGGIVFNQPPVGVVPPTLCKAIDAFGNVLFAQAIVFVDGGVKVKTVHGAAMTYPTFDGLVKLDFSQGNIVSLSDLDPAVTAPKPIPGDPYFTFLRDKSQDNSPIRLGGMTYARGLWIAPETSLTYKMTADFREFKTVIGVDDGIKEPTSKVKLTIEGDGRVLFAGLVSLKDKPKELVLDVKGVRELRIAVEQDSRFTGNQVTLADARLQK